MTLFADACHQTHVQRCQVREICSAFRSQTVVKVLPAESHFETLIAQCTEKEQTRVRW